MMKVSRRSYLLAAVAVLSLLSGCARTSPPPSPPDEGHVKSLIVELVENQSGLTMINKSNPFSEALGYHTVIVKNVTIGPYMKLAKCYTVSAELIAGKKKNGEVVENTGLQINCRGYTLPGVWHFKLFCPVQEKNTGWSMSID
jgi:hypothetical protein